MAPRPTCPLPPSLSPILTYQVHTQTGTPTSLTSLLTTPQTLLIIIRHFYCSSCQDYIRALVSTPALTPSPSSPTKLIIIGCGSPDLIAGYASALNAPWDFYTDPSGALYDLLGLQKSLAMAETRPEYLEKPLFTAIWDGVVQAVRGGVLKGGNVLRNGGEFLWVGQELRWCHRMSNTQDHLPVEELVELIKAGEIA